MRYKVRTRDGEIERVDIRRTDEKLNKNLVQGKSLTSIGAERKVNIKKEGGVGGGWRGECKR